MSAWALIVAAGAGRRMGTATAKQYLPLAGKTVLEHALSPFLAHASIDGIMLVLAADDNQWQALAVDSSKPLLTTTGGAERVDSVLAGLQALNEHADIVDWILVHDAARPCLSVAMLDQLFDELADDTVGGLLAVPARDTLKRANEGRVAETLDRSLIWQAQTPQMFRLGLLREALMASQANPAQITDEAMAMELAGHHPRLVPGSGRNIKITTPEDLPLAEFILESETQA